MNLLVTEIEWDTEGESNEECCLPSAVIVLDAPSSYGQDYIENDISEQLSDAFGFCHYGFQCHPLTDSQDTHGGGGYFPDRLAVMRAPEYDRQDDGKFQVGEDVIVNRDDPWGRIASTPGKVVEVQGNRVLVDVQGQVRANVLCKFDEVRPINE